MIRPVTTRPSAALPQQPHGLLPRSARGRGGRPLVAVLALQPRERLPLGCARRPPASLPAPRGAPQRAAAGLWLLALPHPPPRGLGGVRPAPLRSARRTAWQRSGRRTGPRSGCNPVAAGRPPPRAGLPGHLRSVRGRSPRHPRGGARHTPPRKEGDVFRPGWGERRRAAEPVKATPYGLLRKP